MAFVPKTGATGTVSFGTSNLTLVVTSIGEWNKTREMLDGSSLATTGHAEMYPDVLDKSGPVSVECWFNPGVNLAALGTSETITLTYPKCNAGNNAATLAGTGVIIQDGTGAMAMGALMKKTMQFQFDGLTDPVLTKEA